MGLCKAYEDHNISHNDYRRLVYAREMRKRNVIHDVFNHIQHLIHRGMKVDKWLNTMSRLTNIPRSHNDLPSKF